MIPHPQAFVPKHVNLPTWAWGVLCIVTEIIFGVGGLSFWHWNIAAGLFFAYLWLAPPRAWWWMVAAIALARGIDSIPYSTEALLIESSGYQAWMYFVGDWFDPLVCLLPAWWMRRVLPGACPIFCV